MTRDGHLARDEALEEAARLLDAFIENQLQALEARIRSDIAATGPEDENALDRPPDPDSPWRRSVVEEAVEMQRERFSKWKAETLASLKVSMEW